MAIFPMPQAGKFVHILYLDITRFFVSDLGRLRSLLSPEECAKADKFRFEIDTTRYIAARGVLRLLLGSYLKRDPKDLEIDANSYGKPFLKDGGISGPIYFNLSDSGEYVVYAFNRVGEIGIDIEQMRPECATQEIAEQFFSDREVSVFRALPENYKVEAFYNCWTRKEAFIKAVGEGLSYPLKDFDVTLTPGEPARLLGIRGDAQEASRWTLQEIPAASGYKAAFAIGAEDPEVKIYNSEAIDSILSNNSPIKSG